MGQIQCISDCSIEINRAPLGEQKRIIGRRKDNGTPLDKRDEFGLLEYDKDPEGKRVPLDAHICLANPRTRGAALIL